MKTILLTILLGTPVVTLAQKPLVHIPKAPHAGDTVWPGSQAWIHAGSPRSVITGDSIALIWGSDGKLHSLGYEIEDTDGSWVTSTPEGYAIVEYHKEIVRLTAAVRQIMLDMPDRIIPRAVDTQIVRLATHDTVYEPNEEMKLSTHSTTDTADTISNDSSYEMIMHWNDTAPGSDFVRRIEINRYRYRGHRPQEDDLQPTYFASPWRRPIRTS